MIRSSIFKNPVVLVISAILFLGIIFGAVVISDAFFPDEKAERKEKEVKGKEWKNSDSRNFNSTTSISGSQKEDDSDPIPANSIVHPENSHQEKNQPVQSEAPKKQPEAPKPWSGVRVYATDSEPNFEYQQRKLAKKDTLPYGKLLRCKLVNAVDSINLKTPVIGLVEEDLMTWDGKIIIPKNTEVHGIAQGSTPVRDRIGCDTKWKLVLFEPKHKNKRELDLEGLVLDSDFDPYTQTYSITDGSAGLRGEIFDNTESKEFKLFLAAFISGLSSSIRDTSTSAFGTVQVLPNARNAMLGGTAEVMNEYVRTVREAIRRDGIYVGVRPNKQFYLYIQQSVDLSRAAINAAPERSGSKK